MDVARTPDSRLAARVLPVPLHRALTHVFAGTGDGIMLVGGTALSGYYAGHRRSDDLDLFVDGQPAYGATVLAVRSLAGLGSSSSGERSSAHFHHAVHHLDGHDFTVQVVVDRRVFEVGRALAAADGVRVADVETLLKMKAATLVSRASEKDLYDLAWLFDRHRRLDIPALLALGAEIDAGMNGEAVMISLVGTEPRVSACGFSLAETSDAVFQTVTRVRDGLIRGVDRHLRSLPAPPLAALVRKLGPSRRKPGGTE